MNFSWDNISVKGERFFPRAVVFLLLVFLFTPLAIVQFLCLFLLFIFTVSKLYSNYLIRNIRVSRKDTDLRVFRNEWVRVEIKVENHGLLPAFMLVANDLPGKLHVFNIKKVFCTMHKRSWTLLYWEGLCQDRGVFSIGPAVIRGADPLGLFPFHLTAKETTKLYVYPAVRSITLKNKGGIPLGNMISVNPLFEDITRYRSLRPYHPGDETRRINWKVSAGKGSVTVSNRTQSGGITGILINEYEATASYPVMIFLNIAQNEYKGKSKREVIERVIEAAAALCLKASRERQELGIIIYTQNETTVIPPSSITLIPVLERLAALDWTQTKDAGDKADNSVMTMLNQGKRLSYGTRYIYTGCDLGDEAYIKLNSLKRHHLSLEYIIIDNRALPFMVPGNAPRYQMKESGYEII
jgi:uncharacterized protein (DUF58 family)